MVAKLTIFLLVLTCVTFAQETSESDWTESKIRDTKQQALSFLRANNWAQAESILSSLPEGSRNDPFVSYALGVSRFNLGKIELAGTDLNVAIKILRADKRNPSLLTESLVLAAIVASKQNRNETAIGYLREALVVSPNSFDVNFGLARALFGNADYNGAEIYFRRAVELRPNDSRTKFFHATTLEKLGRNDSALSIYREMIKANPDDLNANLGLGVLLSKIEGESSVEGTRALRKVVGNNPKHYEAQITLGRNLVKQERFAEAIRHLEKAALLKPENPEPQYQLVIAYRRSGKLKESKRAAARVKEIHRNRRATGNP